MKRLAALAVPLILAACSSGPLSGEVVGKSHSPAHSTVTTTVICNGKTCTPIVTPVFIPECYSLIVRTPEGETESRCVSGEVYTATQHGDHITLDPEDDK